MTRPQGPRINSGDILILILVFDISEWQRHLANIFQFFKNLSKKSNTKIRPIRGVNYCRKEWFDDYVFWKWKNNLENYSALLLILLVQRNCFSVITLFCQKVVLLFHKIACGVSCLGIQNPVDFCQKVMSSKGLYFEMEWLRAYKNWANFYKINFFKHDFNEKYHK